MDRVFREIRKERELQDAWYGKDRNLPPSEWMGFIGAELYEARVGLDRNFAAPHDYRTELVQVAALCVAALESYDRQGGAR